MLQKLIMTEPITRRASWLLPVSVKRFVSQKPGGANREEQTGRSQLAYVFDRSKMYSKLREITH